MYDQYTTEIKSRVVLGTHFSLGYSHYKVTTDLILGNEQGKHKWQQIKIEFIALPPAIG